MPERWRALVLLAAWCELRRGELLALRRGDLDLLHGTVRVDRTYAHKEDGRVVQGPPNPGRPTYSRDPAAHPAGSHCSPGHLRGAERGALLFTVVKGGPLRPHVFNVRWSAARIAVGVPHVHLHDLRHAGNTWTAATGASTAKLMARLGDANPGAALRYQHATADRDRVLAEALSSFAEPAPYEVWR
jgi:integrase